MGKDLEVDVASPASKDMGPVFAESGVQDQLPAQTPSVNVDEQSRGHHLDSVSKDLEVDVARPVSEDIGPVFAESNVQDQLPAQTPSVNIDEQSHEQLEVDDGLGQSHEHHLDSVSKDLEVDVASRASEDMGLVFAESGVQDQLPAQTPSVNVDEQSRGHHLDSVSKDLEVDVASPASEDMGPVFDESGVQDQLPAQTPSVNVDEQSHEHHLDSVSKDLEVDVTGPTSEDICSLFTENGVQDQLSGQSPSVNIDEQSFGQHKVGDRHWQSVGYDMDIVSDSNSSSIIETQTVADDDINFKHLTSSNLSPQEKICLMPYKKIEKETVEEVQEQMEMQTYEELEEQPDCSLVTLSSDTSHHRRQLRRRKQIKELPQTELEEAAFSSDDSLGDPDFNPTDNADEADMKTMKKTKVVRTAWSPEELEAISRHMLPKLKSSCKPPRRDEIFELQKKCPVLKARCWKSVKFRVWALFQKQKKTCK